MMARFLLAMLAIALPYSHCFPLSTPTWKLSSFTLPQAARRTLSPRGAGGNAFSCRPSSLALRMQGESDAPVALRTMFGDSGGPPWVCVGKCGACCYLAPKERDLDCLGEEERKLYVSMAGEDGAKPA